MRLAIFWGRSRTSFITITGCWWPPAVMPGSVWKRCRRSSSLSSHPHSRLCPAPSLAGIEIRQKPRILRGFLVAEGLSGRKTALSAAKTRLSADTMSVSAAKTGVSATKTRLSGRAGRLSATKTGLSPDTMSVSAAKTGMSATKTRLSARLGRLSARLGKVPGRLRTRAVWRRWWLTTPGWDDPRPRPVVLW